MMALSKCVLDRVEERKNELKDKVYGLVEIMSRTVFARMERGTRVYKDLLDQLVEQVFAMFKQELDSAFIYGYAHGCDWESSLNQHISNDEAYDLDSEIDDDSLSISTFESQTSSSEQSLDDDGDYDGEEYDSIMAPMDGVDQCVLDRMEERKNNFKCRMYGLVEIMSRSVFARMVKRTSAYKVLLDQLIEKVFAKFTQELNDAWKDGCAHGRDEWNVYSDYGDSSEDQPEMNNLDSIGSMFSPQQSSPHHSNEDSSLHSSPTPSQPSSQSQHENSIEDDAQISDSEIMTKSVPNSSTLFEASSVNFSQQSLQECQLDEEMDDGEYCEDICNNEDTEVEEGEETIENDQNVEHYRYTHVTGNDSDLSVVNAFQNAQPLDNEEDLFLVNAEIVDDDGDNEALNEHRKNQLQTQNMLNIHQLVISNKCPLTAEKPCPFAWGGCTKTFTDDDHLQNILNSFTIITYQNIKTTIKMTNTSLIQKL